MNTRFRTAWMATAIGLSLAGCSRTSDHPGEQSAVADSNSVSETAAKLQSVVIGEGTPIKVRTETELSTKSTKTGERFTATLAEPILIDGKVVAARGAQVEGRVVNSDPGGRVKGVATLSVRLTQLHVGNRGVEINTGVIARKAHTTKRKDAAEIGIGAGVGAAIGALAGGGQGAAIGAASGGAAGTGLVLATHGDPAVLPAESVLTFTLTAPVTVEPS